MVTWILFPWGTFCSQVIESVRRKKARKLVCSDRDSSKTSRNWVVWSERKGSKFECSMISKPLQKNTMREMMGEVCRSWRRRSTERRDETRSRSVDPFFQEGAALSDTCTKFGRKSYQFKRRSS